MNVYCRYFLIVATAILICAGTQSCSDNSQEKQEKSITEQQEQLGHEAAESIKQPIEQANAVREKVETKGKAALEGC